jgi:hypothetical protein
MCLRCGRQVTGDWVADDDTIPEWFDSLAESMGLGLDLDPAHPYEFFRRHCVTREHAGRHRFRLQYLDKDSAVEAMEEAADGGIYCGLEEMRRRRAEMGPSVHLKMAAMFFAKAHECLMRERADRAGTPIAVVDE